MTMGKEAMTTKICMIEIQMSVYKYLFLSFLLVILFDVHMAVV